MGQLATLFTDARQQGKLRRPLVREVPPAIEGCAVQKSEELGVIPPDSFQALLQTWASLHGFVSLEAYGHFDWMGDEARDQLFRSQIRSIAENAGLPGSE